MNEAINLEYNMSRLYGIFAEYIDEDRVFWSRLENEEKNHAALLKTAKEFLTINKLPQGLIPNQLNVLLDSNEKILKAIDSFILKPSRQFAFSLALDLEKSAGEIHYQHFMDSDSNDRLIKIFQQLNHDDKDHAARIENYRREVLERKD